MTRRVLIVDDSLTVRMDLADAFEGEGLTPVPCATLAEARAELGGAPVGLVVLDVMLPDGDGVEFLSELRAGGSTAALPVMLLTTEVEVRDRVRGLRMGADAYVGKPYEVGYVLATARTLTGWHDEPSAAGTVLVIDDSATLRAELKAALEAAGYTVTLAASGREGLASIAARRPDAIIVDGVMPEMDGPTLIRRVRLDAASRATPCLLLTASEDAGAQLRALEAGADAFVRKDEDMALVLARLAAAMRWRAVHPGGASDRQAGQRRILAVDDSITYREELATALRSEGYEVSTARSGEEALELLAVQPVDCILMDLVMPGMDGKEACRRIKAADGVRDIPLILLTAHDDRAIMLEGLSAGADDYISKSSEFEVLAARVLAQIRRKQFEDENRRYREDLLEREMDATRERTARVVAEQRAAMVGELERQVEQRTRELEAIIVERRHAERMASVGLLSASIAHEINNPLGVVVANVELALDGLGQKTAAPGLAGVMEALRDAAEAAERVRQIVLDLRIFSRSDDVAEPVPVDVVKVLKSSIRMASNEIRHRARLVTSFADVPPVLASEPRLGQVVLNLVVNAAQAVPIGQAADNEVRVSTFCDAAGDVVIEVSDTGVGIPSDKLARVFDPFFTTKPAGVGTGLGLAICQRIVVELGGAITAESPPGQGAVFRVTLPAAPSAIGASPAPVPTTAVNGIVQRRARILVVDDEAGLCRSIARILSPAHDVVAETSARAAHARIATGESFDVILSDLMMPDMSGMELCAALRQTAPALARRMVFMSGGAFSPDAAAFLRDQPNPSIEKPFRSGALRAAVDAALLSIEDAEPRNDAAA